MKFILYSFVLIGMASCSWFRNNEEIEIRNPKPGVEIEIKGDPTAKPIK